MIYPFVPLEKGFSTSCMDPCSFWSHWRVPEFLSELLWTEKPQWTFGQYRTLSIVMLCVVPPLFSMVHCTVPNPGTGNSAPTPCRVPPLCWMYVPGMKSCLSFVTDLFNPPSTNMSIMSHANETVSSLLSVEKADE